MKTLKATLSAFLSLSFFIAAPGIAFAADAPPRPDIPTDSRYEKVYQEDQERLLKSIATYRIFLLKVKKLHNTMQKPENQFHLLTVLEHMETS